MIEDVKIRMYKEEDKARCREIALVNWPDEPRVRRHVGFELSHPDLYTLVAEWTDPATFQPYIVGWASWCWSAISYDVAEFVWCNIQPEFQNRRIGRALTEARMAAIKAQKGRAILLTTGKPQIYMKYGFETIDVMPLWIGPSTHLMCLEFHYEEDNLDRN